ncbi:MAG: response regulator [bacterium]|nr:response regulator [bacterium]
MVKKEKAEERIAQLESRIRYLEGINRLSVDALEQAGRLGDFQTSINKLHSHSLILTETRSRLRSLIPFEADAFYLVDENNSEFYLEDCFPESYHPLFTKEIDNFINNGTFAWAIREQRPIFVPTEDKKKKMLFHVLTTSSRVRGMFVGVLTHGEMDVELVSLSLTSIILRYSANALESFELYSMIKSMNNRLEQMVEERTRELQYQVKFENLVAHILESFIDIPPSETCRTIEHTLQSLAEFTAAENHFLFFFEDNDDLTVCIEKLESDASNGHHVESRIINQSKYTYIYDGIGNMDSLYIPKFSQLPGTAENEKKFAESLGIESAVIVPIASGNRAVGFFGFGFTQSQKARSTADYLSGLLKIVGEIIVIALRRVKMKLALQKSRDQFRHAQKMEALGRLAGGVAHDFNNILTAITIASEISLQSKGLNEKVSHKLKEILKASERAANLTRQLLIVSRRQIIKPKLLDVGVVASELNKMLIRLIPEDIDMVLDVNNPLSPIKADPGQIEQILINLAVNARDAIKDNPTPDAEKKISMEISQVLLDDIEEYHTISPPKGQYIRIRVSDTGMGMDSDTCTRIFEPFFTTKQEGKGTGLGLATVYGIVKQNNGGITVHSKPGSGTIFDVFWHCSDEPADSENPDISPHSRHGGSETILLVEDDDDIRIAVRECLDTLGYDVLEAENGRIALDLLLEHTKPPDIMVTDIMMPEIGGWQLARSVRESFPDIKIIFTTGYSTDPISISESMPPNSRFVQKPYSINKITQLIRELMDAI